jgi:hypothetical protein
MKLLREEADRDSRDYSFERGTDDDPEEFISDFGREPCSQTVDDAEDSAEHDSD